MGSLKSLQTLFLFREIPPMSIVKKMKDLITQRIIALLLLFLACALWAESARLSSHVGKSHQEFLQQILSGK
jgi:hypothetical protein